MKQETLYPFDVLVSAADVMWNKDSNYISFSFMDDNYRPMIVTFSIFDAQEDKYSVRIGDNPVSYCYLKKYTNGEMPLDGFLFHGDLSYTVAGWQQWGDVMTYDNENSGYFYVEQGGLYDMYFLIVNVDGNFYELVLSTDDEVQHDVVVGSPYDPCTLADGQSIVSWLKVQPQLVVNYDEEQQRNYATLRVGNLDVACVFELHNEEQRRATVICRIGNFYNNFATFDVMFDGAFEIANDVLYFDGGINASHIANVYGEDAWQSVYVRFTDGRSLPMRNHYSQRTFYSYCDGQPEVLVPFTTPAGETLNVDGEPMVQGEILTLEDGRHTFGSKPQPLAGGCYHRGTATVIIRDYPAAEYGKQSIFAPLMDDVVGYEDGGETIFEPLPELTNFKILKWRGMDVDEGRFIVNIPYIDELPNYISGVIYDKVEQAFYPMERYEDAGYNYEITFYYRGDLTTVVGGYECAVAVAQRQVYNGQITWGISWGVFYEPFGYDDIVGPYDPSEIGTPNSFADMFNLFEGGTWHFEINEEQYDEEVHFERTTWSMYNNMCQDVAVLQADSNEYYQPTPLANIYLLVDTSTLYNVNVYEYHLDGTQPTQYEPLPYNDNIWMKLYDIYGTVDEGEGAAITDVNSIILYDNNSRVSLMQDMWEAIAVDFPTGGNLKTLIHNTIVQDNKVYEPRCPDTNVNEEPQIIITGEAPNCEEVNYIDIVVERRCGDAVLHYQNTDGSWCYLVGNFAARDTEVERSTYTDTTLEDWFNVVPLPRPAAKVTSVNRSYTLVFNDVANDAYFEDLLYADFVEVDTGNGMQRCVVDVDTVEVERGTYSNNYICKIKVQ